MRSSSFVLAALLAAPSVLAQSSQSASVPVATPAPANATAEPRVLDTAVVRMPGPGMWKVRKGGNTLWVLGTVSPLPAGMAWNSARMRAVVATADRVIHAPGVSVGTDVGFFGKLALLPSLRGVRALPEGRTLRDVVPAAQYAQWLALKQRHIGRDESIEHWRPIFAGNHLYGEALKDTGLTGRNIVGSELEAAMKARKLKGVHPSASLKIANPKQVIKEFKAADFADSECFAMTLDRVSSDMPALAARADAWARGDIDALRTLRHQDLADVCERAMLGGRFAGKYGLDKLEAQARAKWIAEVETSLSTNRVTFATLPMNEVLGANGLVAALAAKGYVVEAPQAPAQLGTPRAAPAAAISR